MSSITYKTLGDQLYTIINGVSLTGLTSGGTWAAGFNYEPKEILAFPTFAITPVEDQEGPLDSSSNEDQVSMKVSVYVRYETSSTAENQVRQIVDALRDAVRKNLALNNAIDFQVQTKGRWLYNVEAGLRIYELTITAKKAEDTF